MRPNHAKKSFNIPHDHESEAVHRRTVADLKGRIFSLNLKWDISYLKFKGFYFVRLQVAVTRFSLLPDSNPDDGTTRFSPVNTKDIRVWHLQACKFQDHHGKAKACSRRF
jgi:hypothetical protein